MINDWYKVKGCTKYHGDNIHILNIEFLVKATSIEDACAKTREFLSPIAEFDPTKCEWDGEIDDN